MEIMSEVEVLVPSGRMRRDMTIAERGDLCKNLELSQKSFSMINDVVGDIGSIPIAGDIIGGVTAGVSIVTHLASGSLDIAQTALDCANVPFDDLKEFMQKQINEVNRKLDSNSAALQQISKVVNKTLSAVEASRREMNERFDEITVMVESTKIEPLVSKITNFVRYFESEKERLRGLKEHDYVSKLEEKHGILTFFRDSRTPMCDNSLNNALFDIIKLGYAIPDSIDDDLGFRALYALLYGTEAHVSVMSFLMEEYSYLASYHFKRGEIDMYNECFDAINNIFLEFRSSLVGSGVSKEEPLLDQVIQTLIEVTKLDFLVLYKSEMIKMLNNKINIFKKIKEDIRNMVPTITTDTPTNFVHIVFDKDISVPIGEWEKHRKVQYAVQYQNKEGFSRVGEWSDPITVNNYACPELRLGNDPARNTVLIYRKFDEDEPQLVGYIAPFQQKFSDIDRDLYNAAENPEKDLGFKDAKILLNQGASSTVGFESGRRALHAAAKSGNTELALGILVKSGSKEISVADDDGYTPMHIAADKGNSGFVKFLISHRGSVNAKTLRDELTPLHLAARRGFQKTFRRLVEAPGVNVNEKNKEGFTPLHYAVLGGQYIVEDMVKIRNIDINAKSTKKELTPFHMAVINDDRPVAEALMKTQKIDVNDGDKNNMTPLHYAAMLGYTDMAEYLLSLPGINPNSVTRDNKWSPLHYAIIFKQDDIALKLLKSPTIDDSLTVDGNNTPLHFAVTFGRKIVLLELLARKVNIEAANNEGYTALHLAAKREDPVILSILLNNGANIDARTANESTPLHLATFSGRSKTALTLLDKGAKLNVIDKDGQTPVHGAALNNQLQVLKELFTRDPTIIDMKNKNLDTPLNVAAQKLHTGIVKYLVDNKADVNTKNKDGISPLIEFAKSGSLTMVKYLIEKGADVYVADKDGNNFLYHAIKNDHLDIVEYAINSKRVELKKEDENRKQACAKDCTIEYFAVCDALQYGKLDIVKYLVGDLDKNLCEPLAQAARYGWLNIVQYLVEERNMDVNPYKDWYNKLNTPLCNAAMGGHIDIVNYLVQQRADIHTNCDFQLAIDFAIQFDHLYIVKFLAENGADLKAKNRLGYSPLYTTFRYQKYNIAKFLVEEKTQFIDINERDVMQNTPLITAIYTGQYDLMVSLVEKGADVQARNKNGETALDAAKRVNNKKMIKYMESKSKRSYQRRMASKVPHYEYVPRVQPNKELGFVDKYIGEESSGMQRRHAAIHNTDIIGTIMLLDVIIRYFTEKKYVGTSWESEGDPQAIALKMTEDFETFLLFFAGNLPDEAIDFSEVHKNIHKALETGKEDQIHQILCSSMKQITAFTMSEIEMIVSRFMSTNPPDISTLSFPEAQETYNAMVQDCLEPEAFKI